MLLFQKMGFTNFATVSAIVSCVFFSRIATAQNEDMAREKFEQGIGLFEKGDYPAALTAFEESYELRNSNSVLYNIGMCQRALFKHVQSINSLKKFLRAKGKNLEKEELKEIVGFINEMKTKVAAMNLNGAPKGSEVRVDGVFVATMPLPDALYLNQGTHVVEVQAKGFLPYVKSVKATAGGKIVLSISLEASGSTLRVECDDPAAKIFVNGKASGKCPYESAVVAGEHRISVEASNKEPLKKTIIVPQGGFATVAVRLGAQKSEAKVIQNGKDQTTKKSPITASPQIIDKPRSGTVIAGWVLTGLGIAGGVLGGVFTYVYVDDKAAAEGARDRYNNSSDPSDEDRDTYNEAMDKLSPDRAGMALGYISAGVLITTGVVLLLVGNKKEKEKEERVAVTPTAGGLSVTW